MVFLKVKALNCFMNSEPSLAIGESRRKNYKIINVTIVSALFLYDLNNNVTLYSFTEWPRFDI